MQAQILNLLKRLEAEDGLTSLFISHNLAVVRFVSTTVGVMYLGRLVEVAPTEALFEAPRHPYTQALLSAIPVADLDHRSNRIILEGDVPNPVNPPAGCPFHPRCRYAMDKCKQEAPRLQDWNIRGKRHLVSCHLMQEKSGAMQGAER